jgi:hypothetical protein
MQGIGGPAVVNLCRCGREMRIKSNWSLTKAMGAAVKRLAVSSLSWDAFCPFLPSNNPLDDIAFASLSYPEKI